MVSTPPCRCAYGSELRSVVGFAAGFIIAYYGDALTPRFFEWQKFDRYARIGRESSCVGVEKQRPELGDEAHFLRIACPSPVFAQNPAGTSLQVHMR